MNIEYVQGDLLESDCTCILHGCNTIGYMGAGIAKAIRNKWPSVYAVNQATHRKLGAWSSAKVTNNGKQIIVVNIYTQDEIGRNKKPFRLHALITALEKILPNTTHLKVGMPKIGAGLGGGSWPEIEAAIKALPYNQTIYVYTL